MPSRPTTLTRGSTRCRTPPDLDISSAAALYSDAALRVAMVRSTKLICLRPRLFLCGSLCDNHPVSTTTKMINPAPAIADRAYPKEALFRKPGAYRGMGAVQNVANR